MPVTYIQMTEIIDHIIGILDGNTEINTFLTNNSYGTLSIFDNPNGFNPPGEVNSPFISLYRDKMQAGEQVNEWIYTIELEIGLKDESEDSTGNVTEQTGLRKVEEYGNIVYNEIAENINCNLQLSVADIEWDETSHPLYLAYYGLTIRVQQVIGAEIQIV